MLGPVILLAFVWGMVAFAVAIDASRREQHAGFWAILTFFTGVFGAILYGLVILTTSDPTDDAGAEENIESEMVRVCPTCSSEYDVSHDYCDECGGELGPDDEFPVARRLKTGSKRYCSNCKSKVDRKTNRCPSCDAVF